MVTSIRSFRKFSSRKRLAGPPRENTPFHLVIRNNKINVEDLKAYLYMSMGDYVFSRAKLEKFSQAGNRDAVVSQALRVIKKNGGADVQGTGGELGEVLKLHFHGRKAPCTEIDERVEISTDGKQYDSIADSIHLLTSGVSGRPYHQVVFALPILSVTSVMPLTVLSRKFAVSNSTRYRKFTWPISLFLNAWLQMEEVALVKDILVPNPSKTNRYNTSYGVFLWIHFGPW